MICSDLHAHIMPNRTQCGGCAVLYCCRVSPLIRSTRTFGTTTPRSVRCAELAHNTNTDRNIRIGGGVNNFCTEIMFRMSVGWQISQHTCRFVVRPSRQPSSHAGVVCRVQSKCHYRRLTGHMDRQQRRCTTLMCMFSVCAQTLYACVHVCIIVASDLPRLMKSHTPLFGRSPIALRDVVVRMESQRQMQTRRRCDCAHAFFSVLDEH